jgi:hypothetical protein
LLIHVRTKFNNAIFRFQWLQSKSSFLLSYIKALGNDFFYTYTWNTKSFQACDRYFVAEKYASNLANLFQMLRAATNLCLCEDMQFKLTWTEWDFYFLREYPCNERLFLWTVRACVICCPCMVNLQFYFVVYNMHDKTGVY